MGSRRTLSLNDCLEVGESCQFADVSLGLSSLFIRMIAIIDYEMGNLRSVQKGFERVGHAATITSDPTELAEADKIVLPGVGAFRDAIAALG
ncbi:MAG: hypothetical protein L0Z07_03925, partial [Planctomycetes bacterium]|nr:hypothetical protein [Planctomycetota bacterium]